MSGIYDFLYKVCILMPIYIGLNIQGTSKVYNVKFRFSEKASNVWKNIWLVVIILRKFQSKWDNFYLLILLPSYNILKLQLKKSAFAIVKLVFKVQWCRKVKNIGGASSNR